MYLSEISLKQFRSYEHATYRFPETTTLITGKNGIGKTNLLEAIYVLFQGTSFRVPDKDLIQSDKEWWRVDGVIDREARQLRYQLNRHPPKHLVIKETNKRFTYKDRLPVILFEPTDLQLIHGSPSRRRDAIDIILINLSYTYKLALGRYERALLQRNNILKEPPRNIEDVLFSWDILLSEYGTEITTTRSNLVDTLNQLLPSYYEQIAGTYESLSISYHHSVHQPVTKSGYITKLQEQLGGDMRRGTTSIGPHRDDFEFMLSGKNAKQSASRGEIRSIILSLKMAYSHLIRDVYDLQPLILLDDVFSELDSERQQRLLSLFGDAQIIITDTNIASVPHGKHIVLS